MRKKDDILGIHHQNKAEKVALLEGVFSVGGYQEVIVKLRLIISLSLKKISLANILLMTHRYDAGMVCYSG